MAATCVGAVAAHADALCQGCAGETGWGQAGAAWPRFEFRAPQHGGWAERMWAWHIRNVPAILAVWLSCQLGMSAGVVPLRGVSLLLQNGRKAPSFRKLDPSHVDIFAAGTVMVPQWQCRCMLWVNSPGSPRHSCCHGHTTPLASIE